ncbi:transcription antitermination factor NusB [Flavihumibacter petaseus]|uniref:Transcription antitermination protein NusB n=1 Tax=Flavihumibacter petaseus NBRC 106054 TaxID=1220578 RepID=A0A0E9N3A6_9BACT|nr:transcription antitermination factor NusB [Flavihumibacter petaseus]GAO44314.1 transcription antitermination factor NusB [Flavihumibacter petaseus NBRC 106054]
MLSRRIIRVKVMQTLYSLDALDQAVKPGEPTKLLNKQFDNTRQLLSYILFFLTEVLRYAETDAKNRAAKHLPSAEDLSVNIKIAGNTLLWKMLEDISLQGAIRDGLVDRYLDKELVRKLYLELVATPVYQHYIHQEGRDQKTENEIVEYIYANLMISNEAFTSHLEEHFNNWDDDCEMVNQLVQQYLNKPGSFDFSKILSSEKSQFAKELLLTVLDKKEETLDLIKPKLKNWDPERIATLDMILMQMGVCEFLYFETIPPKVTINEYIDLAKEYSTNQSGQFVNGILDNIHKDLQRDDRLHKVSYKK